MIEDAWRKLDANGSGERLLRLVVSSARTAHFLVKRLLIKSKKPRDVEAVVSLMKLMLREVRDGVRLADGPTADPGAYRFALQLHLDGLLEGLATDSIIAYIMSDSYLSDLNAFKDYVRPELKKAHQ